MSNQCFTLTNDTLELKLNFDLYILKSSFEIIKNNLKSNNLISFNCLKFILPVDFVIAFNNTFDNFVYLQKHKDLFINSSYLTNFTCNIISEIYSLKGDSQMLLQFEITLTVFLNKNPIVIKDNIDYNDYIKEWDLKL